MGCQFLVFTGEHDDRVDPLHARKLVAALEGAGAQVHLQVEPGASHRGPVGVGVRVQQALRGATFLAVSLGLGD